MGIVFSEFLRDAGISIETPICLRDYSIFRLFRSIRVLPTFCQGCNKYLRSPLQCLSWTLFPTSFLYYLRILSEFFQSLLFLPMREITLAESRKTRERKESIAIGVKKISDLKKGANRRLFYSFIKRTIERKIDGLVRAIRYNKGRGRGEPSLTRGTRCPETNVRNVEQ